MIKITIYKQNENIVGFESKGHANYAKPGFDIICSAISILTQTTVNSIESITKVVPKVTIDEKKGYLKCTTKDITNYEIQIIYKVFEQGIIDIHEAYTKHVGLKYEEV